MHGITIREHARADRPFVRHMLELAALMTYADLATLGRISRRERLDEIFDRHYSNDSKRIWIACSEGGQPLGLVWIQPGQHPVTEKPEYLVLNVAVEEAARGQGVGRALMAHAKAYAEARGVKRLRLFVESSNTPAFTLYRSLGFEDRTREMVWEF